LPPGGTVFGEPSRDISWLRLETKYTIIRYQSFEDLKKLNRKIDYYPWKLDFMRISPPVTSDNLTDEITKKLDAIYEKVQKILGMHKKTKRVIIDIYSDNKQLHAAYLKISKKVLPSFHASTSPSAWYVHENNTIYLNNDDLHKGMLAHEMAHNIIDHYLLTRPPRPTAEILARYVASHFLEWRTPLSLSDAKKAIK